MNCLINVDGGLGKNVMLTALMPILKKKYDDIYVISPYSDVFKCCSDVTDTFEPGPKCATLYQELVLSDDCQVLWKEPYSNQRFIKKQCHLFEAWLEEFGIEEKYYKGINLKDLSPNMTQMRMIYPQLQEQIDKAIGDKPFILVQFCGGQSPLAPTKDAKGNAIPYNDSQEYIKRNYPYGQQLINELQSKYPGKEIVHYALPNEPKYMGCKKVELPYIAYRLLAEKAFKVVCTDSSLQHIATGCCNDITVIWGETRPEHFGYERNKNICAKNVFNSQPYFKPMGSSPSIVKMPSVEDVMKEVTKNDMVADAQVIDTAVIDTAEVTNDTAVIDTAEVTNDSTLNEGEND